MGLNAFEYQCGHGVRLGLDKAAKMAALAAPKDILFSVHAPYYISMSSLEEDKRLNSVNYLLQSAAVCRALGGQRVIFHSGSCGKQSREAALEKALDTLRRAQTAPTMLPSLTRSKLPSAVHGPSGSTSTFPASSIRRAAKNAIGPSPRPSSARNPSP